LFERAAFSSMPDMPSAAAQLGEHVLRSQPELRQHDEAVEPQVGGLADDAQAVAVLGGHDGLGRLSPTFFRIASGPRAKRRDT